MRYSAQLESETSLTSLVTAAQQEPVFIEEDNRAVAVLVSARDYERLRSAANDDFQEFCDFISDRAAKAGLTDAKLDQLLSDD